MGHRHLCGIKPCPILMRAKAQARIDDAFTGMDLSGASPPSVFVGESGYVSAGQTFGVDFNVLAGAVCDEGCVRFDAR